MVHQSHARDKKDVHFWEFIRQVSPDADPTSVLLFRQILRANHLLTQTAEKQLETAGLSYARFRMLLELQRHEHQGAVSGLQPSQLSTTQGICRNSVSALIASLENEGFVTRELHPTDRRKFVIRLTPKGRKVITAKLDTQLKLVTCYFDAFNAAERETLLGLLTRLNQSLVAEGK